MTDINEIDTTTLLVLLMGKVRARVEEHPLTTLVAVASVGYMIGWSLPKAVVRSVGSIAARAAVMHAVARVLASERAADREASDEAESMTVSARSPTAGKQANGRRAEPYVS